MLRIAIRSIFTPLIRTRRIVCPVIRTTDLQRTDRWYMFVHTDLYEADRQCVFCTSYPYIVFDSQCFAPVIRSLADRSHIICTNDAYNVFDPYVFRICDLYPCGSFSSSARNDAYIVFDPYVFRTGDPYSCGSFAHTCLPLSCTPRILPTCGSLYFRQAFE